MKKLKNAQLGITREHASGKMGAARRLSDVFEVVGVVDDSASTTARQNAMISPKPYEGLKRMRTRYDAQLIEFAQCGRGEIENPYPYEHELLVQEVLLAACGNTNWSK